MTDWLVDTAIVVDFLRRYGPANTWLAQAGNTRLLISPAVWMEVIDGAENKLKQQQSLPVLRQFQMIYLTPEDQEWAMKQHLDYHLSFGMGIEDCLIAAPAHRLQIPLYTHNLKHFNPLLGDLAQKPY